MQNFKMPVSKTIKNAKGDNEREKIGDVEVTIPLLLEIIEKLGCAPMVDPTVPEVAQFDTEGKPLASVTSPIFVKEIDKDDGLPIYSTAEANWIFGCVLAGVKAQARNKLQKDSTECKPGNAIASDWASLVAEGVRDGAGLILRQGAIKLFAAYVATLGKNAATAATLNGMFSNTAGLVIQPDAKKTLFLKYFEGFCESLDADDIAKYDRPLATVDAAARTVADADNEFA